MIERGKDQGITRQLLSKCLNPDCEQGVVKQIWNEAECHQCNGLGLVDAETGEALPEREVIRQLLLRLNDFRQLVRTLKKEVSRLQPSQSELIYPEGSRKD